MRLNNKRILITAGPTWVPIDSVRVISNIATGETGILLADRLTRLGAKVTLLLGPVESRRLNKKIMVIHFKFFNQLKTLLTKELKSQKYDCLIHSAAVSDYELSRRFNKKIRSGLNNLTLRLKPTPKLISLVRKMHKRTLIAFKFEPEAKESELLNEGIKLLKSSLSDLVVTNTIHRNNYTAYIINKNSTVGPILSKKTLAKVLLNATVSNQ